MFVGNLLCFFLPFVTVSCGGVKAITLSGQQLATGTTLSEPQPFGPPQSQKVDADPFASLAALCAVVGIAFSVIGRKMATGSAISGGAGTILLLILRSRLNEDIQKQGQGMLQNSFESGYTLALLLFIAGAAWNLYLIFRSTHGIESSASILTTRRGGADQTSIQSELPSPPATGSMAIPNSPHSSVVCSKCGQSIKEGVRFCERCGERNEHGWSNPQEAESAKVRQS
jgi:hypothetical protein